MMYITKKHYNAKDNVQWLSILENKIASICSPTKRKLILIDIIIYQNISKFYIVKKKRTVFYSPLYPLCPYDNFKRTQNCLNKFVL